MSNFPKICWSSKWIVNLHALRDCFSRYPPDLLPIGCFLNFKLINGCWIISPDRLANPSLLNKTCSPGWTTVSARRTNFQMSLQMAFIQISLTKSSSSNQCDNRATIRTAYLGRTINLSHSNSIWGPGNLPRVCLQRLHDSKLLSSSSWMHI